MSISSRIQPRFFFPGFRIPVFLFFAIIPFVWGGCSDVPYYWQAGMGQWEIISKRRHIEEVLADPVVNEETKRKLRLVLRVREFSTSDLALPADGNIRYYTDLGRPYVTWLVVAAQPLALQEYKFCYFIVGCLGYRGFFHKADAEELAHQLQGEGLDVYLRPVTAYSTLGWFDDPVLSTFLRSGDIQLMGTVIHEQAHTRVFIKGDTAFNESFAGFVERAGMRRYLSRGGPENGKMLQRYEEIRADRQLYQEIVLKGRDRLHSLYESQLPTGEKLRQKQLLIEKMRGDYRNQRKSFKILNYDEWFDRPLNNAQLVGFGYYNRYLDAFAALFAEQGRDFERFHRAVEKLGALEPAQRKIRLTELEKKIASRHP